MKNKKLKGVLIKVDGTCEVVEIVDTLDNLYNVCECSCIDIVSRRIGGKMFDIVLDDEGLLKDNPIVTAMRKDAKEMLVGNLFIVKNDGRGNLKSLSDEEIASVRGLILKHGVLLIDNPTKEDIENTKKLIDWLEK